jgi:hypothetical protein
MPAVGDRHSIAGKIPIASYDGTFCLESVLSTYSTATGEAPDDRQDRLVYWSLS